MNDEQIRARLEEMKLEPGMTQEKMNAFVREARAAREENKGAESSEEPYVPLTAESATDQEVSSATIDPAYWAQVEKDYGLTRDEVVAMNSAEDGFATMPEDLYSVSGKALEEDRLARAIRTSGDEVDATVDYSDPKANMPKVDQRAMISASGNVKETLSNLTDKYARYGFEVERNDLIGSFTNSTTAFTDQDAVVITASNGDEKEFNFGGNEAQRRQAAAEMDAWMRPRSIDRYAELAESVAEVGVTSAERNQFNIESREEYAAVFGEGELEIPKTRFEIEEELRKNGVNIEPDTWEIAMGLKSPEQRTDKGEITPDKNQAMLDLADQGAMQVAARIYNDRLKEEGKTIDDVSPAERNAAINSIKNKELKLNDPRVKEATIRIAQDQKEEGLMSERIFEVSDTLGFDDNHVLEALGKEKLAKLDKNQKQVLNEAKLIGEKHQASVELLKAAKKDIETYDAEGRINAIKARKFETQEDVDAANAEAQQIISTHEKLAANYSGRLRDYELISDAAVNTNEKINNLQVDIEDVGSYTKLIGLDYNLLNIVGAAISNAVIDQFQNIGGATALVFDTIEFAAAIPMMSSSSPVLRGMASSYVERNRMDTKSRDKVNESIDAYQAEVSDGLYHQQFSDVSDAGSFGYWAAEMLASQIPVVALMAASGPASLYVMGATSTGAKYQDLRSQKKLYEESGGFYGNDYSFQSMMLNALGTGLAEALSEKITLGQVNAAKGVFRGLSSSKNVKRGIGDYLKKEVFTSDALKATGKDLLEEGGSEAIASMSSNLLDIMSGNKEASFWDGVDESFVSGVMMSGAMKSPLVLKHAMAAFSSPDTDAIREENLIRINELSETLLKSDHKLEPETKAAIEEEIAELTAETTAILEQDIKRVDILSDSDKKKLLGIEKNKRKILARWEAIQKDENLSKDQKEALKERLQGKLVAYGNTKAEMLSQYDPNVADTKYSETTMPLRSPSEKFEENIEFAKKHSALYGLEVDDTLTAEQIREKYGDEAATSDGFVDPKTNTLVINKEVAAATGAVTVGSHELLHGILKKEMAKPGGISQDVIDQLKKEIGSQWSVVQQRIDDNYTEEYMDAHPDEHITLISDALAKGDITYEETVFDKLKETFLPIFRKLGFGKIKFDTGKDVYNFLKEYNKSIHKGALSSAIIEATQDTGGESQGTDGPVSDQLTFSMSSEQRSAATTSVKKLGANNTNKSWRKGGANAAIKEIKDKGYFDALIASKYKVRPVPKEFVEKVYAEITPHIKRFKPEQNNDLFAYINSQIGNKAGNVYNREYKVDEAMLGAKDIDAKTSDGAPIIQVEAETESEVQAFEEQDMSPRAQSRRAKLAEQGKSESDRYSGLRTEIGLEKPMMDKVRKAVAKTFGTKLPDISSKEFKKALQKAYRTELKKPIQDMMGKSEAYDAFISENFPTVFKFLPKETLLQMERNVAPENRIFTKSERITKPVEVDELISQGLLPKDTNRLSGPNLITKLPYPGSKKAMAFYRGQNMKEVLGYEVGGSTLGTRKDKLAMEMGVELGFDATMETVQDPEVAERRESILELTGQAQAENDVSVMAKQIDRDPGIKFSRSSDVFKNETMSLVRDVVNNGFETVFTENGKLVEGYPGDFNKKSIDFAYNLWDNGTLNDGKSIGFKSKVALSDKFSQAVKEAYKKDGNLRYNEEALDKLYESASVLTVKLGPEVIDAIGFEFAGFKNRVMDSPNKTVDKEETARQGKTVYAKDKDGNDIPGRFYERLQELSKKVREGISVALPFGLDLKAVSIMNKGAAKSSVFGKVQTILDKDISRKDKLIELEKLQPEIDAANAANISLAKHIATVIINGVRDGSIDPVSALHLLQAQTGIVNGFRGLSRLDLITVLDGSQKPGEKHPHFNRLFKKLSKTMPKDEARVEAIKRLGSKGEHLAPNSNTMFEIAELFNEGLSATELEARLDEIFRGHSQMLTTIDLTKVMDEKLGATNDTDFNRVKALDQVDIDSTVRADGTPYPVVLAEVEILKEVSRMNAAIDQKNRRAKVMDNAILMSRSTTKPKGITVLDFDDTLASTKSSVLYTAPDGTTGKLNAEEFAKQGGDLLAQGFKFDFSEFNKVVDGKTAPLFNKAMKLAGKFGTENMFILTARAPQSAKAIKKFLNSQGLNIPLKNITGLGKSEASAKADWVVEKVGEGYNDFYFADDAIQNVKAVKDVLDQFDVKGKVQQARLKFSKSAPKQMAEIINEGAADLNKDFNITLEQTKGVKAEKTFSPAKARQRGKDKGKYKFFIPPSADDFAGLMYSFLGKGKQGEKHHAWFKEHLFDPYSKAVRHLNAVQTIVAGDMRALKKAMPGVKNLLKKTIPGTEYTNEHAVRVYNWVKAGLTVPGLSQADTDTLVKKVENNADLKQFAETVSSIAQMPGGLQQAGNDWLAGNVTTDLKDALDIARGTYLDQWKNNVKVIFNDANMNKIEAVYGSNFREALEDSLFRMETGSNRSKGQGRLLNNFMNWINGSIGATMFFNSRSAVLQTLSTVNFINWSDNNPLKAAAAFGNQKQYWSDMVMIFNSDFLKQRRSGLTQDVNTAELAEAIRGAANPARAAMGYLLQIGFTPTQVADSFAIASGGATFYRNRIKSLQEKGMNKAEAENQAFLDFMEIAEETQQSARPDRISQQQASPLGKLILAFQNTPMQYNRLIKKAAQDLVNGRGDAKTHISKILYYGAIQNAIFYSLQTALFAMMFGDDDDDGEERQEAIDKKTSRVMNGMVDGILRGAGIGGAVVSTLKNVLLQHLKQKEKLDDGKFYTDYKESEVIIELLNLSPPIGIKARKISSGLKTWLYNRDVIDHMSKTDIDNPIYDATFSVVEGLTNLPLGRAHDKLMNLREAADSDHETWKRVAMFLGWNKWSFGIQNQSLTDAKGEVRDLKDAATEKRREERKVEREKEREEEDQKVEDENLEIQEEERAQGEENILCAAVNRAGKRCGTKVVEGKNFCTIHEEAEQRTDGAKKQCSHVKSDGKRCKMQTSNKSGLCYYHD
jgi:hypothetical protein